MEDAGAACLLLARAEPGVPESRSSRACAIGCRARARAADRRSSWSARRRAARRDASPPAIDVLAELFALTSFERQLLLLCAGVEMDSRLAESCAEVHGSPQKTYATFGLAMAFLPDSHWDAITPSRPLRRFRMLEVQRGSTLTSAPLRVDERILHYLAGATCSIRAWNRSSAQPAARMDRRRAA